MTRLNSRRGLIEKTDWDGVPIPVYGRKWKVGHHAGWKIKSTDRVCDVPKFTKHPAHHRANANLYRRFNQFRNQPGFWSTDRTGIPDGMLKAKAEAGWAEARAKAAQALLHLITKGLA